MRRFNTSGQNIIEKHYTLLRPTLVQKKSTYFVLLAQVLEEQDYKVAWQIEFPNTNLEAIFNKIELIRDKKLVLIIDEVEGINKTYFGEFVHSIRSAYHTRERHALKSVILVGVSNITGIIQDHASPFNIADNLDIPFFTTEETFELLGQHETETGQLFDPKVKEKISEITANIQEIEGQSYREAFVSLGNSDLIINVKGIEYIIETKKYYSPKSFQKGKGQLAYYCNRKNISEGVYIVFINNQIKIKGIEEKKEVINGIAIKTYLIRYDEKTDFGKEKTSDD